MSDNEVLEIELSKISVNPFQPRRHFPQVELEELAQSIRSVGLIQPPVARMVEGGYEIVSGERRFRAAQMVGMEKIPILVRSEGDTFSAEAALVENIQRVDLNAIEIARALRSLMSDFSYLQEELARRVGKKRSTVANYLRLLSLPKAIQDSLAAGEISMGHAKALLSLDSFEKQKRLHELILRDELSVRETEEAAGRLNQTEESKPQPALPSKDCFLEEIETRIQQKLGTKVTVQGRGKRGKISIEYYDLDDLDRVLEILGVN